MNELNSALLEGYIAKEPVLTETKGGTDYTLLTVINIRHYKKDDDDFKETTAVEVEVYGRLARNCVEYLKIGRGLRVISRLKQREDGQVLLVAEHIEFKPENKQKELPLEDNKKEEVKI